MAPKVATGHRYLEAYSSFGALSKGWEKFERVQGGDIRNYPHHSPPPLIQSTQYLGKSFMIP